jgi:hypothetical protein
MHVPTTAGGDRRLNNLCAFEVKLRGTRREAIEDFGKLDAYVRVLHYEQIVFINIDSVKTFSEAYEGANRQRLNCFSAILENGHPVVRHSCFRNDEVVTTVHVKAEP